MITTINLSPARRFSYNIVNNILFDAKMHKIKMDQYKCYSTLLLLAILAKNDIAVAEEVSENSLTIDTLSLWKNIETYTFPTVYMVMEMLKMKPQVIQYLKFKIRK